MQTKDHTQRCETHNGEPQEEKIQNLGSKPIINSMKQVVQGDGRKTWKGTKPTLRGVYRDIWGCFLCQIGSIGCTEKLLGSQLGRNLMLPNLWFNFSLVLTTNITPWGSTMAQLKHWYVFGHTHNANNVTRQGECVPYQWYVVQCQN